MTIKKKLIFGISGMFIFLNALLGVFLYFDLNASTNANIDAEVSSYSRLGLEIIDRAYPGDWQVADGKLMKGDHVMNDDVQIVDEILNDAGVISTLFAGDVRVTTSIKDQDGKRLIGTKASTQITELVLNQGQEYTGIADVTGVPYKTHYAPLKDGSGKIVGMWVAGTAVEEMRAQLNGLILNIIAAIAVMVVIGVVFAFYFGRLIAKSLNVLGQQMDQMASGDFRDSLDSKFLNRRDELGAIARSVESMKDAVKKIVMDVKNESRSIDEVLERTVINVNNLHENIEEISSTTQELAAGMEETAAGTQEMNATSYEIKETLSSITVEAQNGIGKANEVKARAESLKYKANMSRSNARNVYQKTNESLRTSIEHSKSIEQIDELTQTILAIASQTNLLALNAAIEAARAGEAGKGFSVVADQIRKLAEDSKSAVTQIRNVVKDVKESVESLVRDSGNILNFVDTQVIFDYDVLVSTGEQYSLDADGMETILSGFARQFQNLDRSMESMLIAIDEITRASNEGASGSTNIAERATNIVSQANEVVEQAALTQKSSEKLNACVGVFKV